ncbi:MAG: acyl-CoA dehydrogenase, partial [Bacteroidota bacterium]|nr:acyl-CoA dehydrogenase [Bacteroidota bacterium]
MATILPAPLFPTTSTIEHLSANAMTPAEAEAAAARLAPRLFEQAAAADVEGGFPTESFADLA